MLKILQLLSIGRQCSPELRTAIAAMMHALEAEADKSATTTDNQAVAVLSAILTILGLY